MVYVCGTLCMSLINTLQSSGSSSYKAAAPEMISISSPVMTACLVLLKVILNLSVISPALLGEKWDGSGIVRHHRLVSVVHHLPLVVLGTTVQDSIGHSCSVAELRRQTADLGANHDKVLGEISRHEGPGLVANTDDPGVGRSLGGHLLEVGPDGLADVGVDTSG